MKEFSTLTRVYILLTMLFGLVLASWQLSFLDGLGWEYIGLGILASIAQVLKIEGPTKRSSYNISWLVYGFTFVLLGTPAAVLVILLAHLVEWIRFRYPWYIQLFNMASYMVAMVTAGFVSQVLIPANSPLTVSFAMSALFATLIFTFLNHLMIGIVLRLARGESFAESGVFGFLTLIMDFTMFGVGIGSALLWIINPATVFFNVIPLYLFYNALKVPALLRQVEHMESRLEEINPPVNQMGVEGQPG
jgi:hypothetical protein